jgi:hypothetical protein
MKYEIQHYTHVDGWVNTWTVENEDGTREPEYFETHEHAITALMDFMEETNRAYMNGNLIDSYDIREFRIEEVLT